MQVYRTNPMTYINKSERFRGPVVSLFNQIKTLLPFSASNVLQIKLKIEV